MHSTNTPSAAKRQRRAAPRIKPHLPIRGADRPLEERLRLSPADNIRLAFSLIGEELEWISIAVFRAEKAAEKQDFEALRIAIDVLTDHAFEAAFHLKLTLERAGASQ